MASLTVREQILAAAVDTAAAHGLAKLSVADVAKRAGVSRQTVYRHFPSKELLLAEAVEHETATLVGQVVAADEGHDDPRAALEASFATALRATRQHPLVDRLLQTEPEALLPLLTGEGSAAMATVRAVVEGVVGARQPDRSPVEIHRFADVVARLLVSYAVSPPDESPDVVARYVATFLIDGLDSTLGRATAPTTGPAPDAAR
jgi:AcrR family transcriptional regulator